MPPSTARLTIVTSDRPSVLMERLAHDLRAAPIPPLEDEVIVTQSQGMSKWIRLELARRHGCAASLRMPFPAAFCHDLLAARSAAGSVAAGALTLAAGDGASPVDERFSRDVLTWRILDLLESGIAGEPAFAPLAAFLAGDDSRKRLGLAARLAGRFDDYQLYRPELLLAWERGEPALAAVAHARWEAELWRRLCRGESPMHLARAFLALIEELAGSDDRAHGLPRRVSVFGVSTLPPLFVRLLHAIATRVPVRVYVTAPPRESWRAAGNGRGAGHPLFSAFGAQIREFLALLADGEPGAAWEEHYPAPEAPDAREAVTALAALHQDIRRGEGTPSDRPLLASTDDSLRVHVCHSPMREMEVLRDQLFAAFAADPTLRPHDVLVLIPDVTAYAPYIEAAFGVAEPGLPLLPFHIADRPFAQEHSIGDAVLRLLGLVDSRLGSAEVLALLDSPAARRAAGLGDHAPALLHRWVNDTAIRWGVDGADRAARFDLPAVEANSWRAGLDRLLMGYATGPVPDLVAGVLPSAGALAGDVATLGAFAAWADRLFGTLADWRRPRHLGAWRDTLLGDLERFFLAGDDDEANALEVVRRCIGALGRVQDVAGTGRAVDALVVRDWLAHALADEGFGSGFLVGGITFCALKPMRSIPFRVIAAAGLDDASFPRREAYAAFDLLQADPRPGDRNVRADDRQLFFDVLLAAEERLILSYVGRSIVDNKERATSVVLAELLDHLDAARDHVVVEHRLQPFSAAYFTPGAAADARLFSYSRSNAAILEASRGPRAELPPFVPASLIAERAAVESARAPSSPSSDDDGERFEISLADLIECWRNPSRFFCERVLDLTLRHDDDPEDDDAEPVTVDGLTRWAVHDEMLRLHLAGERNREREARRAAARGTLPPGALAGAWYAKLDLEMDEMLRRLPAVTPLEPRIVSVAGIGWEITGKLDSLTTRGRMQVRAAAVKPKDRQKAWLTHLLLNAAGGVDPDASLSHLYGTDVTVRFRPVENARDVLAHLVAGYRQAFLAPLPSFEKASFNYSEQAHKLRRSKHAKKDPMKCAREGYASEVTPFRTRRGDDADPYVALCWRGRDPLVERADEFARWSEILWRSAFEHLQEETP